MEIIHNVDQVFAKLNDKINYTTVLLHTGPMPLEDVRIEVELPEGYGIEVLKALFDGGKLHQESPCMLVIDTLPVGKEVRIHYAVEVTHIPRHNPLICTPKVWVGEQYFCGDTVLTMIQDPAIRLETGGVYLEEVMNNRQGKYISYLLHLENKGNCDANQVWLEQFIPPFCKPVDNSFYLNGQPFDAIYEQRAFLGEIKQGEQKVFEYSVTISQIPCDEYISNQINIGYSFSVGSQEERMHYTLSNEAKHKLEIAQFGDDVKAFSYEPSHDHVTLGDEIYYVMHLENQGNLPAFDVKVERPRIEGLTWQKTIIKRRDSVVATDEAFKLRVDEIASKEVVELWDYYKIEEGIKDTIHKKSTITYTYTQKGERSIDFEQSGVSEVKVYKDRFVPIAKPALTLEKPFTHKKEINTWVISYTNEGNVPIEQLTIMYKLPECVERKGVEWEIDGKRVTPQCRLMPGETITIKEQIQLMDLPNEEARGGPGEWHYRFKVGKEREVQKKVQLEPIGLPLAMAYIDEQSCLSKTIQYIKTATYNQLVYTLSLQNKGTLKAEQVKIKEVLPKGVEILEQQITVDGQRRTANIQEGIVLDTLASNEMCEIQYTAYVLDVDSIKTKKSCTAINYTYIYGNEIIEDGCVHSDEVVLSGGLIDTINQSLVWSIDAEVGRLEQIRTCYLQLINKSAESIKDLKIKNYIPQGTTYRPESMIGKGAKIKYQKDYILVPVLERGQELEISYNIQMHHIGEYITPGCEITYKDADHTKKRGKSNELCLSCYDIRIEGLDERGTHFIDTTQGGLGDVVTCWVSCVNTGNMPIDQLELRHNLPKGTKLIRQGYYEGNTFCESNLETPFIYENWEIETPLVLMYQLEIVALPEDGIGRCEPQLIINEQSCFLTPQQFKVEAAYLVLTPQKATLDSIEVGENYCYSWWIENKGNQKAEHLTIEVLGQGIEKGLPYKDHITVIKPGEKKLLACEFQVVDLPTTGSVEVLHTITYKEAYKEGYREKDLMKQEKIVVVEDTLIGKRGNTAMLAVDQKHIWPEDKVDYTIKLINQGNRPAQAIQIIFWLQEGLFYSDDDLARKKTIEVESLLPKQEMSVTIQCIAGASQKTTQGSKAMIYYEMATTQGIGAPIKQKEIQLEEVYVTVQTVGPTSEEDFQLTLDEDILRRGESLKAQIRLKNTGNTAMLHPILSFVCPKGVSVKGQKEKIKLNDLAPKGEHLVNLELEMSEHCEVIHGTIQGILSYDVMNNQTGELVTQTYKGNEVPIKLEDDLLPQEDIYLVADTQTIERGKVVRYCLKIENKGNKTYHHVALEHLPNEGCGYRGAAIEDEAYRHVVLLKPKDSIILDYTATIKQWPTKEQQSEKWRISYSYQAVESHEMLQEVYVCESKALPVVYGCLENDYLKGELERSSVCVGEAFLYTIHMKNTGTAPIEGVECNDIVPEHTQCLGKTLFYKGEAVALTCNDKKERVTIGKIEPLADVMIQCQLKVLTLPKQQMIKPQPVLVYHEGKNKDEIQCKVDVASVGVIQIELESKHHMLVDFALPGETISYEMILKNKGNIPLRNISIALTGLEMNHLQSQTSSKEILIYECLKSAEEIREKLEFKIPSTQQEAIEYGGRITYSVIQEKEEVHKVYTLPNQILPIKRIELRAKLIEQAKMRYNLGESIPITMSLENTGTLDMSQVVLYPELPKGTSLEYQSLNVDGKKIMFSSIQKGINLGSYPVGRKSAISYGLRIDTFLTKQLSAQIKVGYSFEKEGKHRSDELKPLVATYPIHSPNQLTKAYNEQLVLPFQCESFKVIQKVEVDVEYIACSEKDEKAKYLGIKGILCYTIYYTGFKELTKINEVKLKKVIYEQIPYILCHTTLTTIGVEARVENIQYQLVNRRTLYLQTLLQIECY